VVSKYIKKQRPECMPYILTISKQSLIHSPLHSIRNAPGNGDNDHIVSLLSQETPISPCRIAFNTCSPICRWFLRSNTTDMLNIHSRNLPTCLICSDVFARSLLMEKDLCIPTQLRPSHTGEMKPSWP